MQPLIDLLIGNSVIAAVIAAAALLAMLCRRPALAHVLWILVLVKLVTPPIFRVPVPAGWTERAASASSQAVVLVDAVEESAGSGVVPAVSESTTNLVNTIEPGGGVSTEKAGLGAWLGRRLAAALLLSLWAVGSVWYVTVALIRTRRFARLLDRSDDAAPALLAHVRDIAGRLGLSAVPDVRVVEPAVSPMVAGAAGGPSRLILPASLVARLGVDELRAVLAHELAHLRRRDHWVRWVESAATALMWWHPLLWLARRGLHEAEEQCCDAWVVWSMPDARRAYADALVTTAGLLAGVPDGPLPPGASGLGQFGQLKRRLVMIMHGRSTAAPAVSFTGKWLIAAGVLLALPVLPSIVEDAAPRSVAAAAAAPAAAAPAAKGDTDKKAEEPEEQPPKAKADESPTAQASREQIEAEKGKARARMRQDSRKYSQDEIKAAEELYQVANNKWRTPEAKASLEEMVKKYPKLNRTGCAILYLGQYAKGEEREKYLKQAVDDFSDCFYGNGVQVGAFARYLLGHYYLENGDAEKGKALLKEVVTKYPNSVTHRGDKLAQIAKEDMEAPAKAAK